MPSHKTLSARLLSLAIEHLEAETGAEVAGLREAVRTFEAAQAHLRAQLMKHAIAAAPMTDQAMAFAEPADEELTPKLVVISRERAAVRCLESAMMLLEPLPTEKDLAAQFAADQADAAGPKHPHVGRWCVIGHRCDHAHMRGCVGVVVDVEDDQLHVKIDYRGNACHLIVRVDAVHWIDGCPPPPCS